jgi:sugar lactone lactonase YvrE
MPRPLKTTGRRSAQTDVALGVAAFWAAFMPTAGARAFTPNPATGEAALSVLGQASFTTSAAGSDWSGLSSPRSAAIDPTTGKLFVADGNNNRVMRYASTDVFNTGAAPEIQLGTGTAGSAANQLNGPSDVYVDQAGRLWVADPSNHRVVRFDHASTLITGASAGFVLGQPTFGTATAGSAASQMSNPRGVTGNNAGELWVADTSNNRVLHFTNTNGDALGDGAAAVSVLGQTAFGTGTLGTSASQLASPLRVHIDAGGRLWVSDNGNNRVLRFDNAASLPNGASAAGVLGQPNFVTSTHVASATGMYSPFGLSIDSSGRLFVADLSNNRVLAFDGAATLPNGAAATAVLGQPNFTSTAAAAGATSMSGPIGVFQTSDYNVLIVTESNNNRVLRFGAPTPPPVAATKSGALLGLALLLLALGTASARRVTARGE